MDAVRIPLRLIITFTVLLSAISASAQPPPTVLPLNTSATAVFTHSGQGTDGYRLYIDSQKIGDYSVDAVLANGEVRLPIPPQSTGGRKVLVASAFNANGESRSPDVPFYVGVPAAPGPVRIEIVLKAAAVVEPQSDGSIKVRIEGVETAATVK